MEDGVFNTPGQQVEPKVDKETDDSKTKSKKGRIVIRNLVFDVNETHLRKLFQKYGQIHDVKIPINPSTNKTKGFAFIELENRNKALKAIKELNESKYKGRTILLDLAVEKSKFEEKKNAGKKGSNRDENEKGQKSQRVSSIRNDDDMEEEDEEEDGDFEEEDEEDEEDFDEEDDEEEEDEEDEEEEPQKKEDLTSTIFVRNISYEVGQSEFKDFFQKFGKMHYAKLVINRETETHNGTGFVKFNSPAVAKKLVDESKKLEDGLAVLIKGESAVSDISLELGGRRMIVLPALGKRDVESLKASKKEKDQENIPKNQNTLEYWIYNDKHKKRNIYLANSGLNNPDDTFNDMDRKKFEDNLKEKIEKIKNPNYCISTTRVIFKNLPKHDFDEQDLREVILKVLSQKYDQKIIKTRRLVSKLSIIREKERQDSEGNLRSRGYGFSDFARHEDALFFLSKIKDNYKLISDRLPIVEFAIEDIRELKKRDKLLKKLQNTKKVEVKTDDGGKKKKKEELADKEEKNAEKLARLRISQLLEQDDTSPKVLSEVKTLMKKVKSRGLVQRLKKKIAVKFPASAEQQPKEKAAKQVKQVKETRQSRLEAKMEKKKEEKAQKRLNKVPAEPKSKINEEMTEEENEAMLIKSIKRMIKNNKKSKRRAEDRDDFDDITDAYQRKVQKI